MIRGTARVVLDPGAVRGRLTREDVLVIPFTDTAWTPLFATVGGVVAETGGQLSHTAIVAREYCLPTVVGVKAATRLVRDGQAVTVDGGTGRVWLRHLEPGEEAR
jgi:pyruvate,water dikinase